VAASEIGKLTEAVSLLRQALATLGLDERGELVGPDGAGLDGPARLGRRLVAARVLLSLAFSQHELGLTATAEQTLTDAERLAGYVGEPSLLVLINGQRGAMFLREGRLIEALHQLDRAVAALDDAPEIDQCKIMLNRGEVNGLIGNVAAAKADSARALELAQAYGLPTLAFYGTHNLGLFEFLSGNLPRALELMPSIEQASSDFERGVVGLDRARVLLSAGLVSEADRSLVEACTALSRTELVQFLAEAELTRAEVALLADNPELAQTVSSAAVARLRPRKNHRATALGELVKLRADAAAHTPGHQLVGVADRLTGVFSDLGLPDQARLARLIAIDYSMANAPELPRRLPAISPAQPLELRLYGRLVRTRLAFARGDRVSGLRQARTGMLELAKYQAQFGSLDLQTSSAVRGVSLAAAAITEEIAADRPTSVLTWLERARAISSRVTPLQPPEDQVTADLLTQLRWTTSQLEREELAGGDGEALRRSRQALEQQIRARSWTVQGSGALNREPRIVDLRRALGEAALVAIFVLHEEVHGVVLTERRCWMRRLCSMAEVEELARRVGADLDALALDRIPDPVRAAVRSSVRRCTRRLDDLLLAPLKLPDARIVLLPPGRLASLTWADLPSFRQRPLVIAPSASAWLGAHARFVAVPGRVVAVAGPGLQRAESEVQAVADSWPGCQTLIGEHAKVESFLAAINGAQLVHVAAHGRHQRESPLFSSIKLSDGPVVGYDLDRVPDPPQQVVLSACDLGQATVRPGDEALGLTRALLHSGTSTVISGVAKVSDRGAADLMADYHHRLAAGSTPAYALAEALATTEDPIPFACFGAGW